MYEADVQRCKIACSRWTVAAAMCKAKMRHPQAQALSTWLLSPRLRAEVSLHQNGIMAKRRAREQLQREAPAAGAEASREAGAGAGAGAEAALGLRHDEVCHHLGESVAAQALPPLSPQGNDSAASDVLQHGALLVPPPLGQQQQQHVERHDGQQIPYAPALGASAEAEAEAEADAARELDVEACKQSLAYVQQQQHQQQEHVQSGLAARQEQQQQQQQQQEEEEEAAMQQHMMHVRESQAQVVQQQLMLQQEQEEEQEEEQAEGQHAQGRPSECAPVLSAATPPSSLLSSPSAQDEVELPLVPQFAPPSLSSRSPAAAPATATAEAPLESSALPAPAAGASATSGARVCGRRRTYRGEERQAAIAAYDKFGRKGLLAYASSIGMPSKTADDILWRHRKGRREKKAHGPRQRPKPVPSARAKKFDGFLDGLVRGWFGLGKKPTYQQLSAKLNVEVLRRIVAANDACELSAAEALPNGPFESAGLYLQNEDVKARFDACKITSLQSIGNCLRRLGLSKKSGEGVNGRTAPSDAPQRQQRRQEDGQDQDSLPLPAPLPIQQHILS